MQITESDYSANYRANTCQTDRQWQAAFDDDCFWSLLWMRLFRISFKAPNSNVLQHEK